MTPSTRKLGLWSSLGLTISGYLYAASYIAFAVIFPVRPWSGTGDFASYYHGGYAAFYTWIQVCAFAISLFALLFAAAAYGACTPDKKAYALAGFGAALIFASASCFHYVIQWTSVRAGLASGNFAGLELVAMQNFDSPLSNVNTTAWTLFLGISCLAWSACFEGARRKKAVRIGLLANGANGLISFALNAAGLKAAMFAWTFVLSVTWYVYPMLFGYFKRQTIISPISTPP